MRLDDEVAELPPPRMRGVVAGVRGPGEVEAAPLAFARDFIFPSRSVMARGVGIAPGSLRATGIDVSPGVQRTERNWCLRHASETFFVSTLKS